jgi:signal transduction histidine kinase
MFLNTLSGRFLLLTIIFVMLAEVLIFVPSIARFRQDYLLNRLERAQIASLAVEANDMIDPALERELLENAGVYNVVLRRDEMRELMLNSPIPEPVAATFDLRDVSAWELIGDALARLVNPRDDVIRVMGQPVRDAGLLIEITLPSEPLRAAMVDYGLRILALSAVISIFTAALLFFAVRRLLVKPIRGVIRAMQSYAAAPEDNRRIITPSAGVRELRDAEDTLQQLQTELTSALRQKERLAQLGGAVAKISHDLRNILTVAQLFADRIEHSADPTVSRLAPKLVGSIGRAISLCETTLAFGRVEEPPPALSRVPLSRIVEEVIEGEELSVGEGVRLRSEVPPGMLLRADPEQLHRVLSNLVRNACQALEAVRRDGTVTVTATEDETHWRVTVADNGPGLPAKARENLFRAFQGGARKGGSGLGLTIASELVRGHGGDLTLVSTGETGTVFSIALPKSVVSLEGTAA